jgi:hypothetical protein
MKKRDKKLKISRETLYELDLGKDMKAVLGGEGEVLSCTAPPSTPAGSRFQCC